MNPEYNLSPGILLLSGWQIFLIVLLVLLVAVGVGLFFLSRKMKKQQEEQDAAIAQAKQTVSMLIIDKKRMKMKDANLPQIVLDNTPKLLRGTKVPVVKAKVGPQIMTLIADERIFDSIPVKKEVKASVAGIYIVDVKGIRGSLKKQDESTAKKKGLSSFIDKLREKAGAKPLK